MSRRCMLLLSCALFLSTIAGCSKPKPFDPCSLLSDTEAKGFDSTIYVSKSFPPEGEGAKKNHLCMYYNSNGEPRLMVFVWTDSKTDPLEATKAGMIEGDSKVVEVSGLGDKAAAGFTAGELKLLAARGKKGMVGIRAREPIAQGDARFEDAKALVAKLLGRLDGR